MMIAHRVLFGAALVSMVAAPVCAQDEYLEQIEGQIEAVDELMVEEGFHPILRMFSGTLAAGETERLTLRFEDGVAFQVVGVCDTDCSDLDLTLYDPSGNEVAEDVLPDDFPMLEFAARIAGAYTLEVAMPGCSSEPCYWGVQAYGEQASGGGRSAGESTSYQGELRRETGSLAPGDETLGSGEYVDDYYFTGSAGEEVIIDLRAVDFDPYLLIVAPDDEQEENDDYEGDVSRSLVRFTLPMSGEYRVAVTSYAPDETGRYDLSIRQGVAGADASGPVSERGTLAAGDETLRTGEYVDEFTFEGRPGEHVTVNLRSSDFDTYVMLLGPGEFRHENDDAEDDVGHSLVEADLSDAGTYRVLVTSYSPDQTGGYELRIDRGEVVAGPGQRDVQRLELGGSASGTLEAGDGELDSGEFRDFWVFDAEAGQSVTVEVSSRDFDTYLMLVSPDGDVIDENDDADGSTDLSRVTATLGESGRYRLVATTYSAGETGSYDVSVRSGAATTVGRNTSSREQAPGGGGNVYGVFVGISDYGGRAGDLDYTAQDAIRAAEAMAAGAGMRRDNAIVLTDSEATVANMRQAFEDMGRRVGPDDTFVYFYSGHGDRVPRGGPERSDPDALDETIELYDDAINDNEMSDLFGLIDARVSFIILDSCFSGGFSKDVISVPGRMGFFSSEEDVTSQVASKFRAGGYLAQFIFDGVGERLADTDSDGAISAIELSQYVHERYRSDVKSGGADDYVRTGGPQSGFQHFVVDRGSIGPDEIIFR